jgi:two-component sensor histidine kinase
MLSVVNLSLQIGEEILVIDYSCAGKLDFESPETLGLQLISILVNQLEGEIELKRENGTEFSIRFNVEINYKSAFSAQANGIKA